MAFSIIETCKGCMLCKKYCPTGAISGNKGEHHQIDEAICISCGACGRVCAFGAVIDAHGQPAQRVKISEWGSPVINIDLCISCKACVTSCPLNCLELQKLSSDEVDLFPVLIHADACIGCGFCETACPVEAITIQTRKRE